MNLHFACEIFSPVTGEDDSLLKIGELTKESRVREYPYARFDGESGGIIRHLTLPVTKENIPIHWFSF